MILKASQPSLPSPPVPPAPPIHQPCLSPSPHPTTALQVRPLEPRAADSDSDETGSLQDATEFAAMEQVGMYGTLVLPDHPSLGDLRHLHHLRPSLWCMRADGTDDGRAGRPRLESCRRWKHCRHTLSRAAWHVLALTYSKITSVMPRMWNSFQSSRDRLSPPMPQQPHTHTHTHTQPSHSSHTLLTYCGMQPCVSVCHVSRLLYLDTTLDTASAHASAMSNMTNVQSRRQARNRGVGHMRGSWDK